MEFAQNLSLKIISLKFYTNVKKMFASAQPNFTKQSCHTTIFLDPLITYHVWKIVDLIPQGSSSAGQLQMWYFTLLSRTFWQTFSLKSVIICSIFALLRFLLTFCVNRYFVWISNLYNNIFLISETYLSKN